MSVEIIGRAVRAPGASTPEQLFDMLRRRSCMITKVPADRWDQARYWHPEVGTRGKTYTFAAGIVEDLFAFDSGVFGLSQREAQMMDPQQRMILQLVWRALESANLDHADLRSQRVGVYVGASALDHGNLIVEDPAAGSPYFMTGNTLSIVSNRISHLFGLNGPSLTIDTACSSSLVALDLAMKALESGEVDTAIVGGVNVLTHPLAFVGFAQARMLSPEGLCRAYDNDGMGYVRAEGGAVVILRRSDVAAAQGDRSYARILASAVNSAGRTNGISLPSQEAQAQLLRALYEGNGVDPNRLAFIEGHGTGTKVGDPAEIWSIGTVIGAARRAPIPIGSIKTNIGHTEPASGLLGLMKAVLALEHNFFPASLHFETPNEAVDFQELNVHVAAEPIELLHGKHTRLAGINSFGFGGTNAHVIICDPQNGRDREKPEAVGKVFMASAHTASALDALLKSYRVALKEAPAAERRPLIAAAGANRPPLKHRFVVAADDPEAIIRAIESRGRDGAAAVEGLAIREQSKIAFVFSGNGSQWAGMAVDAYRRNTAFRDRFNVIHALFQVRAQISLVDLLLDPELDMKLSDTKIAQPLLFAIQAALADVLALLGVKPDAVYGHSVGEVAAAYVSGAISLVDAVSVVAKRSYHQDRLAGQGRMAALQLAPDAALAFCQRLGLDQITVAAVNAKGSVTVSGPVEQIMALKPALKAERVVGQVLDIDYPFHHPLIEIAKDDFLEDMAQIALRPSQIPFISTVTGSVLSGNSLDPAYWWSNVREPVHFLDATNTALDLGCSLFVEIGPRPILTSYLKDTVRDRAVAALAIASLLREESAADPVLTAYARVLAHGGAFDRRRAFGSRNTRVELPLLPFEPVDLRHEFTSDTIDLYGRLEKPFTLAGWRVDLSGGSWKNHIDAHLFPDLAEHVVDRKPILPGSAFLDIALSSARQFLSTDQVEISNLDILRPLELSETHLRELSTTISGDTGDIEIKSRDRLSNDDWTLHAIARCRKLTTPVPQPLTAPRRRITRPIGSQVAYATARQFGLDYGPSFQLLREAVRTGERRVEVSLNAPNAAGNPFVTYSLHPIAVDAAFHGLVAIFDDLSGEARGAPYIPVRFGCARLYRSDATIARALIDIRRVSPGSIKVDFTFLDKSGSVIAAFDDCRFKRTYLRQQKPLEEVSFHQTRIPSRASLVRMPFEAAKTTNASMFPPLSDEDGDGSSQMLEAAIYRASFEIARKASRNTGALAQQALPGDIGFQRFLANCLYVLEDIGLASHEDGRWTIASDCSLPEVPAILNALYRDRPDRIAEIVAVNDVCFEAIERLDALQVTTDLAARQGQPLPAKPHILSDNTAESLRVHSPGSVARIKAATSALETALRERPATEPVRRVVELGTVSRSVTASIARLAAEAGAVLVAVESREAAFGELSIAFETAAHVSVVRPSELRHIGAADIVVSAADHVFALTRDAASAGGVEALFGARTQMLLCAPAPSIFADFAFGLTDGWFERGQGVEFPLGQFASPEDWRSLLQSFRFDALDVARHDLADGPLVLVEGMMHQATGRDQPALRHPGLIVHHDTLPGRHEGDGLTFVHLTGSLDEGRTMLSAVLEGLEHANVVYVPDAVAGDGAERLQSSVLHLGMIAGLLQARHATDGDGARKPRLAVVTGLNDSVTHMDQVRHRLASDEGLSSFSRVLRNEFTSIDVHTIDLSGTAMWEFAARMDRALGLLCVDSDNREWATDVATGDVSEARVVPGPFPEGQATTTEFAAATVRQATASQVASIAWQACSLHAPAPDEVLIAVAATGLNFRDVMWAMGMLPEEALEDGFAGPTIGMECAGHVVAAGADVKDLAPGDAVMAVASAAFSTHVCVKRSGVSRLPAGISPVAGATLPVAFLTAYYAIVELARVRPGETILVHGGAGGVGLAALQIAKARGAKVIATAGSVEKRRLLETLGADHVFNSRTLTFVEDVLAVTGQAGVDIVLNSLFSEAMERSLSLLKPFGRFLELGKRDFYADTKIGLRPFRRNISYFGIDADQLLNSLPELSANLLAEISAMFESGELTPLPHRAFRHDEIVSAFRLMQSSGHIGKIVVTTPVSGRDVVLAGPRQGLRHDPDGVHLVLGGIGGFGLAAARWLVERGARKIALCSRRGVADEETKAAIAKWAAQGVVASLHACDATDEKAVAAMLARLRAGGPLKTVVHAAMVLDDALIENLTSDRVRAVVEPKAKAAAIFDRLTRQDKLDHFILFSSATTLVGNPGQANYVAANGYLEGLATARRREGLPALAVGFGAISDTGFLVRNSEVNDILSKRIGKTGMTASQALAYVEDYLARDPGTPEAAVVAIADIDMGMARHLKTVAAPLFEVVTRSAKSQSGGGEGEQINLMALVEGKTQEEGEQIIFQLVANEIAAILRIPASDISPLKIIKDVGLDSLMAMELGMSFRQRTGFEMPLSSVTQSTTVGDVSRKLYLKVTQHAGSDGERGGTADVAVLDHLTSRHTAPAKANLQ